MDAVDGLVWADLDARERGLVLDLNVLTRTCDICDPAPASNCVLPPDNRVCYQGEGLDDRLIQYCGVSETYACSYLAACPNHYIGAQLS